MANRTVKDAHTIHGTNPQYLIESITRSRIYDSQYWKEHCFALTAELMVDKAIKLKYIGGVYAATVKPTPFLCLILKMLQIQPDKDIIVEFIKQEDYKYARALGAFYLRLVGESIEIYKYLETLYNDFRRLKFQNRDGSFVLIHMDEFIDQLLNEERVCDVIIPRIQKRLILEETEQLEPRKSLLDEDLDDIDLDELVDPEESPKKKENSVEKKKRRRSRSNSHDRRHHRRRSRSHERNRRRRRSSDDRSDHEYRSRKRKDKDRYRNDQRDSRRSRSRERDRHREDRRKRDRSGDRHRDRERRRH